MVFNTYKIIPNTVTGEIALNLSNLKNIKDCEKKLKIKFETAYKKYVTTFGQGILGGSYIRIYLPDRIVTGIDAWKNRINEYWFWDKGKNILTKEQVLNAVLIGDTTIGDEIIYFQNQYYILPRDFEDIYKTGNSLKSTIEWLCTNGLLFQAFEERNFEPYKD